MRLKTLVSLAVVTLCLCWHLAADSNGQESESNVVQSDTLMLFSEVDSTALDSIKTLIKGGQYAEAEVQSRELLAKVEAEHGVESLEAANVLDRLVESLWQGGKASGPETQEFAERAIAIKEKLLGPDHLAMAVSLNSLGIVFAIKADYNKAESLFKRALAIDKEGFGPEHPTVAGDLQSLANLYFKQGRYGVAEPLYRRALEIKEKALGPEHPVLIAAMYNLANLYIVLGDYAEGEPLFKRALTIGEKALGPDHPAVAMILCASAGLCYDQGKYAEAETLYKRALAIEEKTLGTEHPSVATILEDLASLYSFQGMFAEAEQLYRRALAINEKALGPERPDVASCLHNLANLCFRQGNYDEVEPLFQRAMAIGEKTLGPEHGLVASCLHNLAILYRYQSRYTDAESLYKRALAVREKGLGQHHYSVAETLNGYSRLQRLRQNGSEALAMAVSEVNIRDKNFVDNATVLSEKDALTYSQFLRNSIDNCLSCYVELEPSDPQAVTTMVDIVLSGKGQVSDGMFERQKALVSETDSATLALAESLRFTKFQLSQLFVQGPGEDVEAYRKEVDSLSMLANDLEADLSRHSASFRKQQDYKNISFERVASLVPENSALVEYLKYDYQQLNPDSTITRYLAVVISGGEEPVIVELSDASEIDPWVDQYRKHMLKVSKSMETPTTIDQDEYYEISRQLYDRIWRPIEPYTTGKNLVLIAPDGSLNMISFAGLLDNDGKYLVEEFPIHYLSSGRDLIRLKDDPTKATGLFALGDPDYNATLASRLPQTETPGDTVAEPVYYATRNIRSGCGSLMDIVVSPLPGTRKEVERIAAEWTESTDEPAVILFGSDASEDKFKADAPGSGIIHLATHGYFLEGVCQPDIPNRATESGIGFVGENPLLLSGLFFAGANLHGEGSDTIPAEDGILTAYEVSAMDLESTELVVLSACETGLGQVQEGEGVYGLRRAFQMAGARTVISALWPVKDEVTADMMGRLYDRRDESLPETLRRLQLESMNELRSQNKADHPHSWGAFIALGDWR